MLNKKIKRQLNNYKFIASAFNDKNVDFTGNGEDNFHENNENETHFKLEVINEMREAYEIFNPEFNEFYEKQNRDLNHEIQKDEFNTFNRSGEYRIDFSSPVIQNSLKNKGPSITLWLISELVAGITIGSWALGIKKPLGLKFQPQQNFPTYVGIQESYKKSENSFSSLVNQAKQGTGAISAGKMAGSTLSSSGHSGPSAPSAVEEAQRQPNFRKKAKANKRNKSTVVRADQNQPGFNQQTFKEWLDARRLDAETCVTLYQTIESLELKALNSKNIGLVLDRYYETVRNSTNTLSPLEVNLGIVELINRTASSFPSEDPSARAEVYENFYAVRRAYLKHMQIEAEKHGHLPSWEELCSYSPKYGVHLYDDLKNFYVSRAITAVELGNTTTAHWVDQRETETGPLSLRKFVDKDFYSPRKGLFCEKGTPLIPPDDESDAISIEVPDEFKNFVQKKYYNPKKVLTSTKTTQLIAPIPDAFSLTPEMHQDQTAIQWIVTGDTKCISTCRGILWDKSIPLVKSMAELADIVERIEPGPITKEFRKLVLTTPGFFDDQMNYDQRMLVGNITALQNRIRGSLFLAEAFSELDFFMQGIADGKINPPDEFKPLIKDYAAVWLYSKFIIPATNTTISPSGATNAPSPTLSVPYQQVSLKMNENKVKVNEIISKISKILDIDPAKFNFIQFDLRESLEKATGSVVNDGSSKTSSPAANDALMLNFELNGQPFSIILPANTKLVRISPAALSLANLEDPLNRVKPGPMTGKNLSTCKESRNFNKKVLQEVTDKLDLKRTLVFTNQNNQYSVRIKPGEFNQVSDLARFLNRMDYQGNFKLTEEINTTDVRKLLNQAREGNFSYYKNWSVQQISDIIL